MQALRILSPHDGDLLNHHDGRSVGDALWIRVSGVAPPQALVTVNGQPVNADAGVWAVELPAHDVVTTLTAQAGEQRHAITVYVDRHSRRRYRFSTDDNIYWLRDLARHSEYTSLFDQPYLAFWRELHQRWGVRVQHNIYWGEPEGFDLSHLSDRYRHEFADCADWLRLSFHAAYNDPPAPYRNAEADLLAADFERVTNEILRFAGTASLSPFTTVHYGEATREGCHALRSRGVLGLAGYAWLTADDQPQVSYYLDLDQTRHLAGRDAWKDHDTDLWFIKHDLVCNLLRPDGIEPHLDAVHANPARRQLMEVMVHEQYFCDFLPEYQPYVRASVTQAVAWLAEHDYQAVFYEEGLLGSPL